MAIPTITYDGLDALDHLDAQLLKAHIASEAAHLHHIEECTIRVHLKSHAHKDGHPLYGVHLVLSYDDQTLTSSNHEGRDVELVIVEAFESLQLQVDKHFPAHKGKKTPRRFE